MSFQEQFNALSIGWSDDQLREEFDISLPDLERWRFGTSSPAKAMQRLVLEVLSKERIR